MDTSRHCKIIKDMDQRIMSGERSGPEFFLLLTAMRDLVDQVHSEQIKSQNKPPEVKALEDQIHNMGAENDRLEEENTKLAIENLDLKEQLEIASSLSELPKGERRVVAVLGSRSYAVKASRLSELCGIGVDTLYTYISSLRTKGYKIELRDGKYVPLKVAANGR
jgi:DNA-directed RNA polymerase specialized sigma24 family protein